MNNFISNNNPASNFDNFNVDALLQYLPSNQYRFKDDFRLYDIANSFAYTYPQSFPDYHCSWYGSAASMIANYNSAFFAGLGTIVKFAGPTDWTYQFSSGDYQLINSYFDFSGRVGVTLPASSPIFTAGVITDPGKAFCVDLGNLIFFFPAGIDLYVDGADDHTTLDYGYFVMMKSSSADYGGVPYVSLSSAAAIAKWDYAFRFGNLVSGQLIAADTFFPYLPVFVDALNFVSVLPPVGNAAKGLSNNVLLYSCILPMWNTNTLTSCTRINAQFYGKTMIPLTSGVNVVPYLTINIL